MLALLQRDLMAGRPGRVSITSLNKPNALLLIGWGDAINAAKELTRKVAKGGLEEGVDSLAESAIIAPSGEIVAQCQTNGDELAVARCDLDLTRSYKDTVFNFARHRRPEHYRMIVDRTGALPPP